MHLVADSLKSRFTQVLETVHHALDKWFAKGIDRRIVATGIKGGETGELTMQLLNGGDSIELGIIVGELSPIVSLVELERLAGFRG